MILVFGARGQLGQELAIAAAARQIEIVGVDIDDVDIVDPAAVGDVMARLEPAAIVNAAAYTKVDLAESEAEAAWRANAAGPKVLAEAGHRAGVPIVHMSTDYVFDGTKAGAYREDDPVTPIGRHRWHKNGVSEPMETAAGSRWRRTGNVGSPHGWGFRRRIWGFIAPTRCPRRRARAGRPRGTQRRA